MSILKIALTGGVACGKSQVNQIFTDLGVDTISLDKITHDVLKPNTNPLKALIGYFGDGILNADNSLNRATLRQILLKSKSNQQLIEVILYPEILAMMQAYIKALTGKLVVIEIPLLVEKNLAYLFDRAIVIDCNETIQLARLMKRDNIIQQQARSMIAIQVNRKKRLEISKKLPTDVVENNAGITDLTQKIKILHKKLINL